MQQVGAAKAPATMEGSAALVGRLVVVKLELVVVELVGRMVVVKMELVKMAAMAMGAASEVGVAVPLAREMTAGAKETVMTAVTEGAQKAPQSSQHLKILIAAWHPATPSQTT